MPSVLKDINSKGTVKKVNIFVRYCNEQGRCVPSPNNLGYPKTLLEKPETFFGVSGLILLFRFNSF